MTVNVRITGEAGQGIQTSADLLGKAVTASGLYVYSYNDAESRIRGGLNFTHLKCGPKIDMAISDKVDILIAHSERGLHEYENNLTENALLVCQQDWGHERASDFWLEQVAEEAGSKKAAGIVGIGAVCGLLGLDYELVESLLKKTFAAKPAIIEMNIEALKRGYRLASDTDYDGRFKIEPAAERSDRLWIGGSQAIALGAVAGGVNFMAAYPMSPSTGIITALSRWSSETGVIIEQAEDEIAAINMVAGASYIGGRAMTATSGGGFCLMTEGISLLGIAELPAVIALCQRPGPATGMATRTAQEDLLLALYAGHGYFPRIILAPTSVEDGFTLTAAAFDLAEKYQVPVIIMTDKLLQDSKISADPFPLDKLPRDRHIMDARELEEAEVYKRYELTASGVSRMALPGQSEKVIAVDSHVHNELGGVTDNPELAEEMAQKRIHKAETIAAQVNIAPVIEGRDDAPLLVISWGSTLETLKESCRILAGEGVETRYIHLRQLWPLTGAEEMLKGAIDRAEKTVVVENSITVNLADLLTQVTGSQGLCRIGTASGRPFHEIQLAGLLREEI